MDWKAIAEQVAKLGLPLLGAALPVPGGAALGSALAATIGKPDAKPEDILAELTSNADAMVKAKEFELTHEETILKISVDAEITSIKSVNETMQVEDKSEHWPTYSWRPFIGFCVGFNTASASVLVLAVFVPVLFGNVEASKAISELPIVLGALAAINTTVLPILGIASYFRGKTQSMNPMADNRG